MRQTSAPSAERVARLRQALADVAAEIGAPVETRAASPATLSALRGEMKEMKDSLIASEIRHRFLEGCTRGFDNISAPRHGDAEVKNRQKDQNRTLKRDIDAHEEQYRRLEAEIAETRVRLHRLHERCVRDLEQAANGIVKEPDYLDVSSREHGGFSDADAAQRRQLLDETNRQAEEAARLCREQVREKEQQHLVQAEIHKVEAQIRRFDEETRAAIEAEAHVQRQLDRYQQLDDAERQLGFPSIQFDDLGSRVILGTGDAGPGGRAPEELRMVTVEFDDDGLLRSAAPHAAHGLQREAEAAVRDDDLPRLLTQVWAKLCEADFGGEVKQTIYGGA